MNRSIVSVTCVALVAIAVALAGCESPEPGKDEHGGGVEPGIHPAPAWPPEEETRKGFLTLCPLFVPSASAQIVGPGIHIR